jgi:DNA-binding NtrC family response regulator
MGPERNTLRFPSPRPTVQPCSAREHDDISSFLSGTSIAITQLRAQIRRVAPYFRTASMTGERGCGAEDVARALHGLCSMRDLRFLSLNAADAEDYFTATDAPTTGIGLIYLPDGEKLSPAAQRGVLRMLRLPASQAPRLVTFVGKGLKPLISAGFFSPELATALGALRIALPSLRERAADIHLLIHDRLQMDRRERERLGERHHPLYLSDEFLGAAVRFAWPGNLHQLHGALDWLLANKSGGTLHAGDLMIALEQSAKPGLSPNDNPGKARLVRLEQVVQEHIRGVLMACDGNKLRTAEILGISRSTLYRMLDSAEAPHELLLAG